MPVPALRTRRLLLRRFEETDAVWLSEILSDPDVRRLTLEEALPVERAVLVAPAQVRSGRDRAHWAITMDGQPCGLICLSLTGHFGPRGVYAGFELRRSYWNRGIATEALEAVIDCSDPRRSYPRQRTPRSSVFLQ